MTIVDTDALVEQKCRELSARSTESVWAACASIWGRVFVSAGPGWAKWPDIVSLTSEAFSLAMLRASGATGLPSAGPILSAFKDLDLEDDGSDEWEHVIDLIEMTSAAIGGQDPARCLETTLRTYLEGEINILRVGYAIADGRPISVAQADQRLSQDPVWQRIVDFVMAL
jgi:hypothetical protein